MLLRLFIGLFLLFTGWQLVSCQGCGPSNESLLTLSIQASVPFRVDTVYGAGATGKLLQNPAQASPSQFTFYQLPVNLNADSTRYILRIDGRQETVTVFYRRKFYYKSRQCGYVYDLFSPDFDMRRQARTTRGRVTDVAYSQNSFDGGFLRSSNETGIRLAIML